MVEEDEKLNKVKIAKKEKIRNDTKDVVQKELCKFYCQASIIIYSIDMYRHCFWFLILH